MDIKKVIRKSGEEITLPILYIGNAILLRRQTRTSWDCSSPTTVWTASVYKRGKLFVIMESGSKEKASFWASTLQGLFRKVKTHWAENGYNGWQLSTLIVEVKVHYSPFVNPYSGYSEIERKENTKWTATGPFPMPVRKHSRIREDRSMDLSFLTYWGSEMADDSDVVGTVLESRV